MINKPIRAKTQSYFTFLPSKFVVCVFESYSLRPYCVSKYVNISPCSYTVCLSKYNYITSSSSVYMSIYIPNNYTVYLIIYNYVTSNCTV